MITLDRLSLAKGEVEAHSLAFKRLKNLTLWDSILAYYLPAETLSQMAEIIFLSIKLNYFDLIKS